MGQFEMFFKSDKLIGLDIGTSTIKVAELDVSKRGGTLVGFAMTPTPPQAVVGGDIINPEAIAESVSSLIRELNTKRKNIAAGLWGTSVIVKKISIPKMDEKLIGDQIRWEAEQYIPFDINEVQIEYEILKGSVRSAEAMDILLVAARSENVYKYAEIIAATGLNCSILDVGGFALSNCYFKNYANSESGNAILLNMGASVTNFVAIEHGEVVFCRDVPVGGLTYTGEIQKAMGISFEEAESMKISVSTGQPAPEEVAGIIQTAHEIMIEELQGSIDFYLNTSPGTSLGNCYITGGCSRTPGLIAQLSKKTKLSCEMFNPFQNIGFNDQSLSMSYISQIKDFAAVAMGLGLRKDGDS